MKGYCIINIALGTLNSSQNKNNNENNSNNLIPIVVIDKHTNYYGIEWISIVNIIHRNCEAGTSFEYNQKTDTIVATVIYLDKVNLNQNIDSLV